MVSHHIQYCIYCVPGYRDTGYPGIRVLSLYVYMQYLWFLTIFRMSPPATYILRRLPKKGPAAVRSLRSSNALKKVLWLIDRDSLHI